MKIRNYKFYFFPSLIMSLLLCGAASAQDVLEGQLVAQHSGKCLDIVGRSRTNGALVVQWPCNSNSSQRWRFEPAGAKGVYFIVSVFNNLVLDVEAESTANGAKVHMWEKHGGQNQKWGVKVLGDDKYAFKAKHSGKCLDIEEISQVNGARAHQWDYLGGANQQWELRSKPKVPESAPEPNRKSHEPFVQDSNRPDPPQLLTIFQNGGYVARFLVTYQVKGEGFNCESGNLAVGQKQVCEIPPKAENIRVNGQYSTVFAWKELFSFEMPMVGCLETFGTVFSPQVREVSCE
jgi:hypothetical protein